MEKERNAKPGPFQSSHFMPTITSYPSHPAMIGKRLFEGMVLRGC